MKAMFNWAVAEEKLPSNPLALVRTEQKRPPRETVISDADLQRMLDVSSLMLRALILVAIDSGMRRTEVLNLKWAQIEDCGRVSISWMAAKTNRSRSVRLSDRALEALDEMPRTLSPFVFANPETLLPWSKTYIWERFNETCDEAEVKAAPGDERVHFHDQRHSFVTRTIRNGTPLAVAMRAAGHVTLAQVSRYLHLEEEALDEMKERNDLAIAARKGPKRPPTVPKEKEEATENCS